MFSLIRNLKSYNVYHNERAYIPCTNASDQSRQLAMTTAFPFFNRSIFTTVSQSLALFSKIIHRKKLITPNFFTSLR
jgi:hypothetical protein